MNTDVDMKNISIAQSKMFLRIGFAGEMFFPDMDAAHKDAATLRALRDRGLIDVTGGKHGEAFGAFCSLTDGGKKELEKWPRPRPKRKPWWAL